jgi:hypothetical protein
MTFRKDLDKIEEERRSLLLLTNEERNAIVWAGRLRGKSFEEIHYFLITNYSSQLPKDYSLKDVQKDLSSALNKLQPAYLETAAELVQIEAHRFDVMLNSIWDKVTNGDVKAVDAALSISRERRKMLGLDEPDKIQVDWKVTLAQLIQSGDITPADIVKDFGEEVLTEVNYKLLELNK